GRAREGRNDGLDGPAPESQWPDDKGVTSRDCRLAARRADHTQTGYYGKDACWQGKMSPLVDGLLRITTTCVQKYGPRFFSERFKEVHRCLRLSIRSSSTQNAFQARLVDNRRCPDLGR